MASTTASLTADHFKQRSTRRPQKPVAERRFQSRCCKRADREINCPLPDPVQLTSLSASRSCPSSFTNMPAGLELNLQLTTPFPSQFQQLSRRKTEKSY